MLSDSETETAAPSAVPAMLEMLYRPQNAMRRILDSGRHRWIPFVLAAALLSSLNESENRPGFIVITSDQAAEQAALIAAGVLAGCLLFLAFFYGLSWIAWLAGRMFGGTASRQQVLTAMAWGLMPVIAGNALRLPLVFLLPIGVVTIDATTCGVAALAAGIRLASLLWYLVVASLALAETHRIGAFEGAATLVLTWLSPIVIAVAALLSFR